MQTHRSKISKATLCPLVAALAGACGGAPGVQGEAEPTSSNTVALTAQNRIDLCATDPRVATGLMSARICAGGDIFARETFGGNGRTCTTCHPFNHNTTIDGPFVQALRHDHPADPLFVFEDPDHPQLAQLEDLNGILNGNVLENVDGFEDPTHKFVERAVPHTLGLKMTISADPADPKGTVPPVERVGWGGDGAPDNGSLRSFLNGAIKQHYTKTLARVANVDFRVASPGELDLVNEFQQSLGRTVDLDLAQVNLFDPVASQGKQVFVDPQKGRCSFCHLNAGANFQDTGKGRNFDTEIRTAPAVGAIPVLNGLAVFDGGFGGIGLAQPNMNGLSADPAIGEKNSFGNGTFNTPSLIEAADTPPFFHNNPGFIGNEIEGAVFFYVDPNGFGRSQAAKDMVPRFGTPIAFTTDEGNAIGRFLRAINVAFNLDLASQRISAVQTVFNRCQDTCRDLQVGLLQLADTELNDALTVLGHAPVQPFYPVSVDQISQARSEIAAAIGLPAASRPGRVSNALSRVQSARNQIGSNINYNLGQGNLMF